MKTNISTMSDKELDQEFAKAEDHDCTYEDDCVDCKHSLAVQREMDARELWNSDDDRVRESVGHYRES